MGIARGSTKNGKEISTVYQFEERIEVLRFRFIKSYPGHNQEHYILLIPRNFIEEDTAIIANWNIVSCVELFKGILDKKASLTGRIPLAIFFMREEFFGYFGEGLDGEGKFTVVPEEIDDGFGFGSLSFDEEVGDGHLEDSEHAAPSWIGGEFGCGKDGFDVAVISDANKFLVIGYLCPEEGLVYTWEHAFSILFV